MINIEKGGSVCSRELLSSHSAALGLHGCYRCTLQLGAACIRMYEEDDTHDAYALQSKV